MPPPTDADTPPGFTDSAVAIGASTYGVATAGEGPAVLLLHGFPQDRSCWRDVAPALAGAHAVVAGDLKGVGSIRAPRGGPLGEGYSKREVAAELVEVMAQLGHERFAVAGHDRGARVAYRMALDHPDRVERLCVLNVVPTSEQFDRLDADSALEYWPFLLLAQPEPFAERLIAAGRTIGCPVLVHWGGAEDAMNGPLPIWRRWATDVRGGPLPGGHFIPEEAGDALAASLRDFLTA